MTPARTIIRSSPRHFLPGDFRVTTWDALLPNFEGLLGRSIRSGQELMEWLRDISELEAVISEDASWRQIRMTCDTEDKAAAEAFAFFCLEIQPKLQPLAHELNRKLTSSPYLDTLDPETYFPYLRSVRNAVALYRPDNVPIMAELSVMQQQYGVISGGMTIEVNGKEYTLQQAAKFMEGEDRGLREEVFRKTTGRRLRDREALDTLFSGLLTRRETIARNAGFDNYRDYRFAELGRFDYTAGDCFVFHDSVRQYLVPLAEKLLNHQKNRLGLDILRPWDTEAEPAGTLPLEPFLTGDELLDKTITCFDALHPFFGDCLRVMQEMKRLDLDSRKGKAPGGYSCPLAETGVPFIFMNAAGQMRDVTTMVHEGGHAVHAFLSQPLELNAFREYPMEIAEVASMTMELLSMDHWEVFFPDPVDLQRARLQQLERVISIFPWIAVIDKFQHWIYTHPGHSGEERTGQWISILEDFSGHTVDWTGFETFRAASWQKQLHLFEVPFYYIEYGIAQLGAIAIWKHYRENRQPALDQYLKALSLGNTRTLKELYRQAGISFDFSPGYIRELSAFIGSEIDRLI